MKKLLILTFIFSSNLWAYGIGYTTFPLMIDKHLLSGELNSIMSDGGGLGLQARYSRRLNRVLMIDGGFGVAAGERDSRFFVGADYELIPDYLKQPRISLKANFERAREYGITRNVITLAPTFSKGFNLWGHEAFPFIALPVGLSLDPSQQSYASVATLALGVSGKLPFKGYSQITGNIETTFNIKDGHSGISVGLSYTVD